MSDQPIWYRQSLYEQAWENYRNEDDNYRSTMSQYLIFAATLTYVATQAKSATVVIGSIGLMISLVTVFYLGRVTRYSWRWLIAKDEAIGEDLAIAERNHLTRASTGTGVNRILSAIPGYILAFAMPIAGAVLFGLMIFRGSNLWGP